MTPQNVRAPRPTARRFQQSFVFAAELAQVRVAGKDHFVARQTWNARIARHYLANALPVNLRAVVRRQQLCVKARVIEKLSGGTRQHEAAMGVSGFGIAPGKRRFAGFRVEVVSPMQFIRKPETVTFEFESPRHTVRGPGRLR